MYTRTVKIIEYEVDVWLNGKNIQHLDKCGKAELIRG